jgi:Low-density lipoprotein receptor domain class A
MMRRMKCSVVKLLCMKGVKKYANFFALLTSSLIIPTISPLALHFLFVPPPPPLFLYNPFSFHDMNLAVGRNLHCPNEFLCHNGEQCIPNAWVCDNAIDCADGSDENLCGKQNNGMATMRKVLNEKKEATTTISLLLQMPLFHW